MLYQLSYLPQVLDDYDGSSCDSGTWGRQEFDQGSQQRLTTLPKVMNEFEETRLRSCGRLLVGDPPVRTQPRSQHGTKAFDYVDRNFMESIAIVITGVFPRGMTHRVIACTPIRTAGL